MPSGAGRETKRSGRGISRGVEGSRALGLSQQQLRREQIRHLRATDRSSFTATKTGMGPREPLWDLPSQAARKRTKDQCALPVQRDSCGRACVRTCVGNRAFAQCLMTEEEEVSEVRSEVMGIVRKTKRSDSVFY